MRAVMFAAAQAFFVLVVVVAHFGGTSEAARPLMAVLPRKKGLPRRKGQRALITRPQSERHRKKFCGGAEALAGDKPKIGKRAH